MRLVLRFVYLLVTCFAVGILTYGVGLLVFVVIAGLLILVVGIMVLWMVVDNLLGVVWYLLFASLLI